MATKEVDVAGLRVKIGYTIQATREAVLQQIVARDPAPLRSDSRLTGSSCGAPRVCGRSSREDSNHGHRVGSSSS